MDRRNLVADVTAITTAPATTPLIAAKGRSCNGLNLPVGGVLSLPNGDVITLTAAAAFKPVCTPVSPPAIIANGGGGSVTIDPPVEGVMPDDDGMTYYSNFSDPFLASTFPQCYALAATTVVAYTLVIMLFITPRSFLDGGVLVLGQRSFTQSGSGLSIGGRPWLQKVAALTVAISLTIATAATFDAAEEQYSYGIQNAKKLQKDVLEGNELKIIRIISNTFLWLAQAQTLIRLFPRQREKVIIKWTAFALISLDVIFQSLNSFQYADVNIARPGAFNDAVPALSYLFTLALGVLYAAWVIYYSLMKKRYAYYHPQMKNMCLVAALSLLAILVPVVFFILDLAKSEFTGWGEYVRWVGAAAASVIVWEWVERIEALEREEKRDGILGREVFEGDEMLDVPTLEGHLRRRKRGGGDNDSGGDQETNMKIGDAEKNGPGIGRENNNNRNNRWPPAVTAIASRYKPRSKPKNVDKQTNASDPQPSNHDRIRFLQPPLWPARPAPAVTPVSRTDTASAASTVYAVRYHHALTETTSHPTPPPLQQNNSLVLSRTNSTSTTRSSSDRSVHERDIPSTQEAPSSPQASSPPQSQPQSLAQVQPQPQSQSRWRALSQALPLKRGRAPDEERALPQLPPPPPQPPAGLASDSRPKWDIRDRFEEFAATQAERLREKFRPTPDTATLPVTVIPAPPRRGAALAQLLEEEEQQQFENDHRGPPRTSMHFRGDNSSSTTLRASRSGSSGESVMLRPAGVNRGGGLPVIRVPAPPRADSSAALAGEPESRRSGIGRRPSESNIGGNAVLPPGSNVESGGGS